MARLFPTKGLIFLFRIAAALSLALGLLPFKYNSQKNCLVYSVRAFCYCVGLHFVLLCLECCDLEYFMYTYLTNLLEGRSGKISLATILGICGLLVLLLTVIICLLCNFMGREKLTRIQAEMQYIYRCYIEKCDENFVGRRNKFLYKIAGFEIFIITLHFWNFINNMYLGDGDMDLKVRMISTALFLHLSTRFFIKLHFNILVAFVYCCFDEMNRKLGALAEIVRIQMGPGLFHVRPIWVQRAFDLSESIDNTLTIHSRLVHLTHAIRDIYQVQMIFITASSLICIIAHTMKVAEALHDLDNMGALVLQFAVLLLELIELWLSIDLCQSTIDAAKETREIVNEFDILYNVGGPLARTIESFNLLTYYHNVNFYMCGLFEYGYKLAGAIILGSFLHMLIIIELYAN